MSIKAPRTKQLSGFIVRWILLVMLLVLAIGPLFWQLSTSLRPQSEYYDALTLFPRQWTLQNYIRSFQVTEIARFFLNSVFVTALTTIFSIIIAALGAYSLSRFEYPGKKLISRLILLVYMFPPILFVVPIFLIMFRLGLTDSHTGLILSYTTFSLPFALMSPAGWTERIML